MDKKTLEEFLNQHCIKAYRSGRTIPTRFDDEDEPRWRSPVVDRENLVIRNGRLIPSPQFGGARPPGRPLGSPNTKGRKLSWELPKE